MIVYMFHAIGDVCEDDWADPHYSYSEEKFERFIKASQPVFSLKEIRCSSTKKATVITFDDGHISNYKAAKLMHDNGYGFADFFINPDKVGQPFYMNWEQIVELSEMGMSVQSHGLDHSYFTDCDGQELKRQLKQSKLIIEKHTHQPVSILAPPGGRYDLRTSKLAIGLGYQCIANSHPGKVRNTSQYLIPRLAVLKGYSVSTLTSAQNWFSPLIVKLKIKYALLKIIKLVLGNQSYDHIRGRLMGGEL